MGKVWANQMPFPWKDPNIPLAVGTFEDSHLFLFGWDMLVRSLEGNQLVWLVQEMVAFARYSVASLGSVPKVGF